jgi:hypothetical protein
MAVEKVLAEVAEQARWELREGLSSKIRLAPVLLRLAFHDALTYVDVDIL